MFTRVILSLSLLVALGVLASPSASAAQLALMPGLYPLGPEQIIQAGSGDLQVPGYSVPSLADWNGNGRLDLIVGEGGFGETGSVLGKVRVYLNEGTAQQPIYNGFSYVQSGGADLMVPSINCQGAYPRVVDWDGDGRKDLLVGLADGSVRIYLNEATDAAPAFGLGQNVQYDTGAGLAPVSVGLRASADYFDFTGNGVGDLVVGGISGDVRIYPGLDVPGGPSFGAPLFVQTPDGALAVPTGRSSPVFFDADGDGLVDLLSGNTEGQLLLYHNVGTALAPVFGPGYHLVSSDGVAIDLPGSPRSRPFIGDYNGDGYADVLIGSADGRVRLYTAIPEPASLALLALGGLALRRRR